MQNVISPQNRTTLAARGLIYYATEKGFIYGIFQCGTQSVGRLVHILCWEKVE